jgi:hypothetical protein
MLFTYLEDPEKNLLEWVTEIQRVECAGAHGSAKRSLLAIACVADDIEDGET